MEVSDIRHLLQLLEVKNQQLDELEGSFAEQKEEIEAQKEELTAAIEELISKNKSLELTLAALQQRNYELDQILYRASHDLKSPVTSLHGLLNLLQVQGTAEEAVILQRMQQKIVQMYDVLRSLTMFSEASFQQLQVKNVDLPALLEAVKHDLSYLPAYENVEIRTALIPHVWFDAGLLSIILKALLSNAITFRNPLEPGFVQVDVKEERGNLILTVTDDGDGVLPGTEVQIFELFYRGSEKSTGVGIGLYLVKKIADRLKGTVSHSRKEGSTIFQVVIPLSDDYGCPTRFSSSFI